MKEKNTNKGITLIALIITIIVMLVLVAVTISMAVNGGIFNYAGKAVSDMQNAIDLEQQLADGKIKIGDKWYASIDDYINNNPITTGIEVTPTEITLKKKDENKPILSFYYEGFPYLAIWSKPKSPFIVIAPWMTTADSVKGSGVFRQKTDILLLPPNKEFECKYTVEFF